MIEIKQQDIEDMDPEYRQGYMDGSLDAAFKAVKVLDEILRRYPIPMRLEIAFGGDEGP